MSSSEMAKEVKQKLSIVRNADAEMIHRLWMIEVASEKTSKLPKLKHLLHRLGEVMASTKDGNWLMIHRSQLTDLEEALKQIILEAGAL